MPNERSNTPNNKSNMVNEQSHKPNNRSNMLSAQNVELHGEPDKYGKVWLVGAGPGDVGLLTLKARQLIEMADVIVLDRLVGHAVLALIPSSAKIIDVGKEAGRHTMKQSEINKVIADEAQEGRKVVRLKGGDPFVFGRGGEELEELIARGIKYEIVPGVTSAVAAAAYAGIPVTHRHYASSLHIITAHRREDGAQEVDYEKYAKLEGTLVFMMGASSLSEICNGLIKNGMQADTPAAVIERGTTAEQRCISGVLATIVENVREKGGARTPAIVIVGKVASLGERFCWRDNLPLSGQNIVVTRTQPQQSRLAGPLRELGADVLEAPVIRIEPRPSITICDAAEMAVGAKYIIFTSANGVECFMRALMQNGIDIRRFSGSKIAAIGPGTERALNSFALNVDFMPKVYNAEQLAEGVSGLCARGDKVVTFRAEGGSSALKDVFVEKGIDFFDVPVYDTVSEEGKSDLIRSYAGYCLGEGRELIVTLTSASCARSSARALGEYAEDPLLMAVCIGEMTAKAARESGFANILISREATIDSMIESICEQPAGS
ncbi:MAG: uroporphyrinogen-III C-methyltransferase [Oscillospiraceae bacterium]|nr:uroporphyrinogen-III C-methyltransferase [Oscillospiraceae bacterium]